MPTPFLFASLLALVTAQGHAQDRSETRARPNVLLILADDMGYGDLGCYGSTQIPTPNIDRLAAGGVRATQGYMSSLVCAPSRAGLMTGRYQNRFGFEHNLSVPEYSRAEFCGLPPEEVTFADRLGDLGYDTAAIGKWHLGEQPHHHPLQRGFDSFFGMIRGSHGYFPTPEKNKLERDGEPLTEFRTAYLTDEFTLEALDFVQADHEGSPWMLYLSYNAPHTPLEAKAEDEALFADVEPKKRRTYCAMVHNLDQNVGRIVDALEKSGQLDNTLIVFSNDNGGSCDASHALNAPLRGQKGTVMEGGMRVPFIWHWPARLPAGQVYREPIISLDLVPTFVAAAGGSIEPRVVGRGARRKEIGLDGVNLLPHLQGDALAKPHEDLFWRISLRGAAVRSGDWKLLRLPHRGPELYNVADDRSELKDLAAEHPDRVAEMMLKLHDWECSFERNPMFMSAVRWSSYCRRLYEREYELSQPDE